MQYNTVIIEAPGFMDKINRAIGRSGSTLDAKSNYVELLHFKVRNGFVQLPNLSLSNGYRMDDLQEDFLIVGDHLTRAHPFVNADFHLEFFTGATMVFLIS